MNPLMYNTLNLDQYLHIAPRLNIFQFSANNLKNKFKILKNNPLVFRARQNEYIDV